MLKRFFNWLRWKLLPVKPHCRYCGVIPRSIEEYRKGFDSWNLCGVCCFEKLFERMKYFEPHVRSSQSSANGQRKF
jgi:hypothetical protein